MYQLGEYRNNRARIIKHEFIVQSDGSTIEDWADSFGASARMHVGPNDRYVKRPTPVVFNWPTSGVFVVHLHRFPLVSESVPPDAEWIDTSASPWECYEFFAAAWERCGGPFIGINQDVICRPDVLESFADCPEPWCRYSYTDIPEAEVTGCVRWRPELRSVALEILHSMRGPQRHWNAVGEVFAQRLRERGYTAHLHTPPVIHLDRNGERTT